MNTTARNSEKQRKTAAVLCCLSLSPAVVHSQVARIAVSPNPAVVAAGDTLRLRATAYDANNRPIENATIRWFRAPAARFEGRVDSTGLVTAGAVAVLPVRVVASASGSAPSAPVTINVQIVPGPAADISVTPDVRRLVVGQSLQLAARTVSARGDRRADSTTWTSTRPSSVMVTRDGRVTAVAPGRSTLRAAAGGVMRNWVVEVLPATLRTIEISGNAGEARTGDVLHLRVDARDAAGRTVTGLTPSWSITPASATMDQNGTFVAAEAGEYTIAARLGAQSAETVVRVRARDVRRPTTTVGRMPFGVVAAEFWPHPNGRNAYYTTESDKAYALDISDPAHVRITDSLTVDARGINDFMTTADGRWGVMTREGASSRRNGIVIVDLADPAHPRAVADYTETVSGGVHSTFVYTHPRFGTHVYLTDDATGSMRVIDINDPLHPREIARWQPREVLAGNYVHDLDVRDGFAYLAYWNDGLIILDVGNGLKGGSPSNPVLVSQYKYDLDDLYRNVEAEGGAGFIRGAHTAWRDASRPLVYVGDEVFTARPMGILMPGRGELGKANGRLHVIDVSDIEHPREVAWYEPPDGGVHNVWVAGDTLYVGDYQGGLRVVDISGDLRGDLLSQGREIAHVHTGDSRGLVPNASMAWGAFYVNGLVWVNDMYSGLWTIRVEPRQDPRRPDPVP